MNWIQQIEKDGTKISTKGNRIHIDIPAGVEYHLVLNDSTRIVVKSTKDGKIRIRKFLKSPSTKPLPQNQPVV